MSTKLITDGSLDIPPALIERYDISVVQPIVIIDNQELLNGIDITPEEFFERQRSAKVLPQTSQPAPRQFSQAFSEALQTDDRILYIGISAALSGTFNSAQQAAQELPADKIVLHNTRAISAAGGFQVIAAARALEQGKSLEEALAAAKRTQQQTELFFSVDDLTYLIKGGRIGRLAGMIGSFFNIRPIIQLDKEQGTLVAAARVRSFKTAMRKLMDKAVQVVGEGGKGRFMLLYSDVMEREAKTFRDELHQRFDVCWFDSIVPSPILCAHTGPRALGLVVAKGDW